MGSARIRFLATLLLASQSLAAASVGLAHVSDRVAAPAAIEAEHGSACVVQHDPARCPGCQAKGVAALPEPYRAQLAGNGRTDSAFPAVRTTPVARPFLTASAPRGPPPPLA